MAIDRETVAGIARLARIELDTDELEALTADLETIVGYVERLQEVDTSEVEGIANVTGLVNVTRDDEPAPCLPVTEVLANAPEANQLGFLVPKAVER